jgi:RecG-like helicase
MTAPAGPRGGIQAHRDSVRLPVPELIRDLRDVLGAKLVAYIGSVKETRAVRQWAEGERQPSADTMQRLRTAYHVAALLAETESRQVVQAWFQGMNPQLDDVAPARLLREGSLEEAAPAVLAAARTFVAAG